MVEEHGVRVCVFASYSQIVRLAVCLCVCVWSFNPNHHHHDACIHAGVTRFRPVRQVRLGCRAPIHHKSSTAAVGSSHQPAVTALAVPTMLTLNMEPTQNWQQTKLQSEMPMKRRTT